MNPKISICTRAYNTEKYITKCIDSVLQQSFLDFEYFIIDNGSNDDTTDIIYNFAKNDKRIKPIYLETNDAGFSSIKFLAENATGEYLTWLDSDDWFEKNFLQKLYEAIKEYNTEIAVCGTFFKDVQEHELYARKTEKSQFIEREKFPDMFRLYHQFFRTMWGKLFSSSLVKNNINSINSKIPSYLKYGGDTFTALELLRKSNGIYLSQEILHNYRINPSSVSYKYYSERFQSDVFLFHHAKELLSEFGEISEKNEFFLFVVFFNALKDTLNVLFTSKEDNLEKLKQLNVILQEETTKELFLLHATEKTQQLLKNLFQSVCEISALYRNSNEFNECLTSFVNLSGLFDGCGLNGNFIMNYRNIMIFALESKWVEMKTSVIDFLADNKISPAEEEIMINILRRLSALTEDANVFILASKLLVRNLAKQGKKEESKKALIEIEEMLPTDPDIAILKQEIEE